MCAPTSPCLRPAPSRLTTSAECPTDEACAFSHDDSYVLAHTGGPEHVVVVWRWADERPVGMLRAAGPIGRVRFNPGASTLLSINSPMRICRLSEKGHFKEIDVGALKRYGQNAVDHDWLSATKLAVVTAFQHGACSLLVFNDGSLQQTIKDLAFVPKCVRSFQACAFTTRASRLAQELLLPPVPIHTAGARREQA